MNEGHTLKLQINVEGSKTGDVARFVTLAKVSLEGIFARMCVHLGGKR